MRDYFCAIHNIRMHFRLKEDVSFLCQRWVWADNTEFTDLFCRYWCQKSLIGIL